MEQTDPLRDNAKEISRILKILSVETRVRIVYLLKKHSLCVNALASHLHISQGAVSQHLRVMRDAGLVIDDKQGYYVHYRLSGTTLAHWRKLVDRFFDPESTPELECIESESTCGED